MRVRRKILVTLSTLLTFVFASTTVFGVGRAIPESSPQTSDSTSTGGASGRSLRVVPAERRYALLIGVDEYPDWARDLRVCAKDARDLAAALEKYAGFPSENVFVTTFEKGDRTDDPSAPTAENGRSKISELASTLEPDAFLFVLFSGHDVEIPRADDPSKKTAYFCPCDVDFDKLSSFVDRSWVADELEKSRAKRILFLVDACREEFQIDSTSLSRSALARGGLTRGAASAKSLSTAFDDEPRSFLQISPCRSGQCSIEDGENGLFTRALVDGLRGGAANRETGELTIPAWFDYALRETEARSRKILKLDPTLGADGQKVQTPSLKIG